MVKKKRKKIVDTPIGQLRQAGDKGHFYIIVPRSAVRKYLRRLGLSTKDIAKYT
jgi:hypothetical protein